LRQERAGGAVTGVGTGGDAHAAVHRDGAVVQGDRQGERHEHPLADRLRDVRTAVDDDGEFVAADAGHDVAGAHAAAQPLGEDEEEFVARRRGRDCR
jgi:hypothetical protein